VVHTPKGDKAEHAEGMDTPFPVDDEVSKKRKISEEKAEILSSVSVKSEASGTSNKSSLKSKTK